MRLSTKAAIWGGLAFAAAVAIGVARTKPTPTVQITVPRGYHGPILIVFDEPSGEHLRWLSNTLRLDIPSSGVLKIKEGMDAYPHGWIPTAYTDDGQRLPIPLSG